MNFIFILLFFVPTIESSGGISTRINFFFFLFIPLIASSEGFVQG